MMQVAEQFGVTYKPQIVDDCDSSLMDHTVARQVDLSPEPITAAQHHVDQQHDMHDKASGRKSSDFSDLLRWQPSCHDCSGVPVGRSSPAGCSCWCAWE
jgi:hypothetical protein